MQAHVIIAYKVEISTRTMHKEILHPLTNAHGIEASCSSVSLPHVRTHTHPYQLATDTLKWTFQANESILFRKYFQEFIGRVRKSNWLFTNSIISRKLSMLQNFVRQIRQNIINHKRAYCSQQAIIYYMRTESALQVVITNLIRATAEVRQLDSTLKRALSAVVAQ